MPNDDPKTALNDCWVDGPNGEGRFCRWCHHASPGEHDARCPCLALSMALEQRDALAAYVRAERRNATMQGAVRLASRSDKAEVRRRRDETVLQLEAALARLRELGIKDLVR